MLTAMHPLVSVLLESFVADTDPEHVMGCTYPRICQPIATFTMLDFILLTEAYL
jgi:hypothetical protein